MVIGELNGRNPFQCVMNSALRVHQKAFHEEMPFLLTHFKINFILGQIIK